MTKEITEPNEGKRYETPRPKDVEERLQTENLRDFLRAQAYSPEIPEEIKNFITESNFEQASREQLEEIQRTIQEMKRVIKKEDDKRVKAA